MRSGLFFCLGTCFLSRVSLNLESRWLTTALTYLVPCVVCSSYGGKNQRKQRRGLMLQACDGFISIAGPWLVRADSSVVVRVLA